MESGKLFQPSLLAALLLGLAATMCWTPSPAFAEFRSAQDMQKECRVAMDLLQDRIEKSFQNLLFTGECIGYIQATADTFAAMAENISWFKVCMPNSASTLTLIQKFIAFVDKNPKYTLASTAIQLMLVEEYPCKK